jgi:hypothetical protein
MNVKSLLQRFITVLPEQNVNGAGVEDKDENLARWIPRRVIWEDVPECISVGLKREGFVE